MDLLAILEEIVKGMAEYAIVLFEIVGIIIITLAGAQGVYNFVRRDP